MASGRAIILSAFVCLYSFQVSASQADSDLSLRQFALSAYRGLDQMRGSLGFVSNSAILANFDSSPRVKIFDEAFGLSDIAFDLLTQIHARFFDPSKEKALGHLRSIITQLELLPRHTEGLFYRWYSPLAQDLSQGILDADLSSVDNLHLALALWTVAETYKTSFIEEEVALAKDAWDLFSSMDFSIFFDAEQNLIGGNLKATSNGWVLEAYRYHLGSEARSIYFLGYALNLFKRIAEEDLLLGVSKAHLETVESPNGPLFRVWDGGIFQYFLPSLLIGEKRYLSGFEASQKNVWRTLNLEPALSCGLRPMSSATLFEVDLSSDHQSARSLAYLGKAGHPWLKEKGNDDEIYEDIFVPHAVLLAGMEDKKEVLDLLSGIKNCQDRELAAAYLEDFGFVSSVDLALPKPKVVPGAVGIDKTIEALTLFSLLTEDKLSPSARQLALHPGVQERLARVYSIFEKRLR